MLSALFFFLFFVFLFWTFAARMVCRLIGRIPVTSIHPPKTTSLPCTPTALPSTPTPPGPAHALGLSLPCRHTIGQGTTQHFLPLVLPPVFLPPPFSHLTLTSYISLSRFPSQNCMVLRLTFPLSPQKPLSPYPNLILLAVFRIAPACQFLPPGSAAPVPETEEPG